MLLILTLVLFRGLLSGTDYVGDDVPLVAENPRLLVHDSADWGALIAGRYWDRRRPHERLWRPLPMASLALEQVAWRGGADGAHRVNVALHALVTLLVWGVLRRLSGARLALVGAALFAAHPVHAEAVATVVGRCELLALAFLALAGYAHLRGRESEGGRCLGWFGLAGASLFLAFLSKEVALPGPALLGMLDLARPRPPSASEEPPPLRRIAAALAPFLLYAVALAAYLGLRALVLQGELLPLPGAWALGPLPLEQRVILSLGLAREALLSLALPLRSAGAFPLPGKELASLGALLSLGLHVSLVGASLHALAQPRRARRALGAAVLGIYLALLPSLNLVPIGVARADRLLYTPSLFLVLALVSGLELALPQRGDKGRLVWSVALAALLIATIPRLDDNLRAWADPFRLWNQTLERYPSSGRAHLELARLHTRRAPKDPVARQEALEHLRQAVAVFEPRQDQRAAAAARCALARLVAPQDTSEAIRLYEEARAIAPSLLESYQELAAIYVARSKQRSEPGIALRDLRLAERVARKAANHVAPYTASTWLQLGRILAAMGQRDDEAIDALGQAIARSDDAWEAHLFRARLLAQRDGAAAALPDFQALLERIRGRPDPERRAHLPEALLGCVRGLRAERRGAAAALLERELRERFPRAARELGE